MSNRTRTARSARASQSAATIDKVFALVIHLGEKRPAATLPRRLTALFRELAQPEPERDPDDIEDLIWAHWIAHKDLQASSQMAAAIEAIGAGALDLARPMLDRLVEKEPRWAEAWNKRATLAFIEKRDADALLDIEQTLLLEPRHFGAVSGFGQICLRHERYCEARAAFQVALGINPHLLGLQEAIDEIGCTPLRELH